MEEIDSEYGEQERFDVFFALDTASDRLGGAEAYFNSAVKKINIDHHISNKGCGDVNYVVPTASSTSELIYDLTEKEQLDEEIAKALYIGIIHDTGVFQYSNTSPETLRAAAKLISYGFDFSRLIEETFYEKPICRRRYSAAHCWKASFSWTENAWSASLTGKPWIFMEPRPRIWRAL